MSDLAEAIEHWYDYTEHGICPHSMKDEEALLDAARRVLEAEQVQWCETHDNWPGHRQDTTTCSIVPKLLVDGTGSDYDLTLQAPSQVQRAAEGLPPD